MTKPMNLAGKIAELIC